MNLFYAMGGGLGHLTRARAFLHQFGLEKNTALLTFSEFAGDKRVVGNINIIEVSKTLAGKENLYVEFIQELFAEHSIETIYLDTFPFGIKGEFSNFDFGETKISYIARLLDWGKYLKPGVFETTKKFDKCFLLEYLEEEHKNFVFQNSNKICHLRLAYPKPALSSQDRKMVTEIKQKKNFWLVVHSGGADEILDLVCIADEQRRIEKREVEIVIITPMNYTTTVPNCSIYDIYPAAVLFPLAERIFTACGFNIMQQTLEFKDKHQFIPYPRAFDKQHLRAERFR